MGSNRLHLFCAKGGGDNNIEGDDRYLTIARSNGAFRGGNVIMSAPARFARRFESPGM